MSDIARDQDDHEGGCGCGHVRYRMTGAPMFVHCCHCGQCQRQSGSAFVLNGLIEADRVTVLAGDVHFTMLPTPSGRGQKIARCPRCQVAVWSHYMGFPKDRAEAVKFLRLATLDDPDRFAPDIHIYTSSMQSWLTLPPDALAVAEYYGMRKTWPEESLRRYTDLLNDGD